MGQSHSNDNSDLRKSKKTQIYIPPVSEMKLITSSQDIRYGDVKFMQTQKGVTYAVKSNVLQDTDALKVEKARAELIIANQSDQFMVMMLSFEHTTQKDFCSSFIRSFCIYEYYQHDLQADIQGITKAQQMYEEIDIIAMMYCTINALIALQSQQKFHGDLRPQTILMTNPSYYSPLRDQTPESIFKITDIQALTSMNAYSRQLMGDNSGSTLYLSPEQLEQLNLGNPRPTYDPHKSDVFSVGLVAIEMATLHDMADLYDMSKKIFINSRLQYKLDMVQQSYSVNFLTIVQYLLSVQPEYRPDLSMVLNQFKSYESELSNYFNSTLVRKRPQRQQQPVQQQLSYVRAAQQNPLETITNRDPVEVFHYVDTLDDKVKLALKRSAEVQKLYLNSRVKSIQGQQMIQMQHSNNLNLYSELAPISRAQFMSNKISNDNQPQDTYQRSLYSSQQQPMIVNSRFQENAIKDPPSQQVNVNNEGLSSYQQYQSNYEQQQVSQSNNYPQSIQEQKISNLKQAQNSRRQQLQQAQSSNNLQNSENNDVKYQSDNQEYNNQTELQYEQQKMLESMQRQKAEFEAQQFNQSGVKQQQGSYNNSVMVNQNQDMQNQIGLSPQPGQTNQQNQQRDQSPVGTTNSYSYKRATPTIQPLKESGTRQQQIESEQYQQSQTNQAEVLGQSNFEKGISQQREELMVNQLTGVSFSNQLPTAPTNPNISMKLASASQPPKLDKTSPKQSTINNKVKKPTMGTVVKNTTNANSAISKLKSQFKR